jgi:transposase
MSLNALGIDVSKAKLHLALFGSEGQMRKCQVGNDTTGFESLSRWLNTQGVTQIHACLEATNTCGNEVARYLYQQGHIVSVVNPSRVKGFAQSELSRTKTDSADAGVIARFCARMQPRPWKPSPVSVLELQQMTRRREDLQHMLVQEKNRLETAIESVAGAFWNNTGMAHC